MPIEDKAGNQTVLAFDTSGGLGSLALVAIEKATGTATSLRQAELGPRTAAAQLMPAIRAMLTQSGVLLPALRAIVVVHGPGSFTGVRVAVSTAKGLAHASGVPLVAISRLAVLASLSRAPRCLALLDAGRGELYAGSYRDGSCEREWLASLDEVRQAARSGLTVVAAEDAVAEYLSECGVERVTVLDAAAAAAAAARRVLDADWDDVAALDANYLRHSDAQLFARVPARSA